MCCVEWQWIGNPLGILYSGAEIFLSSLQFHVEWKIGSQPESRAWIFFAIVYTNFYRVATCFERTDLARERSSTRLSCLPYSIVSWYLPILGLYISGFLLLWEGPYVLECTKNPVSVPQFPSFLNNYRRRLCLFSTFKILEYLFICLGMNTVNQLCFFLIIQCWAEVPLLTPWSPKLQLTPKREILFYPKAGAVARPRLHEHTNHPF